MSDTADAHAHRLEQARRLLEELGYTANSDGSYSPPPAQAPAPARSDATIRQVVITDPRTGASRQIAVETWSETRTIPVHYRVLGKDSGE